jgi:hypothetical protein
MIYIILNAIPILAATLAGLLFGVAYSAFARRGSFSPAVAITAFIAEFWLAAILAGALILAPPKGGVWTMTLGSAFVIWIGFVVPVIMTSYRFRSLPNRAALADSAHWLCVMLIQASMLRLIGLVPPPV